MSILGVDVSSHQGLINFDVLKGQRDFIIMKATEGFGLEDPQFQRNRSESRKSGMLRGFYHFARPDLGNSPETEAKFFTDFIDDLQDGELLVLDFEVNYGDAVNWCYTFLQCIKNKYPGYKALIYMNAYTANRFDWSKVIQADHGLWLAYWDQNPDADCPQTKWPVVAMRQYSETGNVDGISGNVDMNVFYGDKQQFTKYGYAKPVIDIPSIPPIEQPTTPEQPKPDEIRYVIYLLKDKVQHYLAQCDNESDGRIQFENFKQETKQGETIQLVKENLTQHTEELIIIYSKFMDVETLSQRLQNSFSYAVPVQLMTSALGVIIAYYNKDMPVEVVFAFTTIVGIILNALYAAVRFLGSKAIKEKQS